MNGFDGGDGGDGAFADVVNNLSGGPWRARRHRRQGPAPDIGQGPATAQSVPDEQPSPGGQLGAQPDEWAEPAVSASVVRPYTWTGGRTAPILDLAVETLVSTTEHGHEMAVLASAEHRAVAELCRAPRSVAEVAALLSLPLGVARVLLADMAEIGLILVHHSAHGSGDIPDMALMERVLSGLRRL